MLKMIVQYIILCISIYSSITYCYNRYSGYIYIYVTCTLVYTVQYVFIVCFGVVGSVNISSGFFLSIFRGVSPILFDGISVYLLSGPFFQYILQDSRDVFQRLFNFCKIFTENSVYIIL